MHIPHALFLMLSTAVSLCDAQAVGKAHGFAAGVTGGGTATPQYPADINQLKTWLSDSTPRVIMINKEFNFKGSEGTTTGNACHPNNIACSVSAGGQDWILDTCDSSQTPTTATYDNAGTSGMTVGSNKSIIGVGSAGVIRGKGLKLGNGVKNVIIQNIHITELNPKFVWGGDAVDLGGVDGIWIDHVKFSSVGRQMIVSHYNPNRVTISNCEFDGRTSWSSSCNGDHYWGLMLIGTGDKITFDKNYLHDLSGRSPKIGGSGTQLVQAVNNYFSTNSGHNFDVSTGASVLIEGNRFENSPQPITSGSSSYAAFNVPDAAAAGTCGGYLGRSCMLNALSSSGSWPAITNSNPLSQFSSQKASLVTPIAYGNVKSTVLANAGVGKIGN